MKTHVFIDAENIPWQQAMMFYEKVCEQYDVNFCDVIGKLEILAMHYFKFKSDAFRLCPCNIGKNSADTWLTVYMAKAIYEEDETGQIVILSSDRDFVPIIKLALERQKFVLWGIHPAQMNGIENTIGTAAMNTEFLDVKPLSDEKKSAPKPPPTKKTEIPKEIKPPKPQAKPAQKKKSDGGLRNVTISQLPKALREYYRTRYIGSSIMAMKDDVFYKLPFINGMDINMFTHLMRSTMIYSKSAKVDRMLRELGLKKIGSSIWYMSEQELAATIDDK